GARVHDIAESRSLRTASLMFDRLKFLRKIFSAWAVDDFIVADDQRAKTAECNDDLPVRISDEQLLAIYLVIRSSKQTVTAAPAPFPIDFRKSALIGSMCFPFPIAMNELRNG